MRILRFAAVDCNGNDVSWIESESLDSVAAVRDGDYSVSVAVVELLFIDEIFLASVAVVVLAILIRFGA
jgi:hypothetical protein